MNTAHLFAGAGGGLLADLILGHTPVLAVEHNAHRCAVLRQRAAQGWFPGLHVHEGDVRTFDYAGWRGRVDCLAAGFPCQDISAAGSGKGIHGERSGLWVEVVRAVDALRPRFVFLENSPRIRTKGRHVVLAALVERGYAWRDGRLAASDVGAGHRRDRWWCLAADADSLRQLEQEGGLLNQRRRTGNGVAAVADDNQGGWDGGPGDQSQADGRSESSDRPETAADDLRHRLERAVRQGGLSAAAASTVEAAARYTQTYHWAPPDAGVCRVVDELAQRMDRIAACGDGQVPLQAAAAWLILSGQWNP